MLVKFLMTLKVVRDEVLKPVDVIKVTFPHILRGSQPKKCGIIQINPGRSCLGRGKKREEAVR